MKSLIAPVLIIVGLIVFFYIVDLKEFSRHNDIQTVQGESPLTIKKPLVSGPETKKAIESKPAVDIKPVAGPNSLTEAEPTTKAQPKTAIEIKSDAETKQASETKTVKTQSTSSESIEQTDRQTGTHYNGNRLIEEKNIGHFFFPEAIPLLSQIDAAEANIEAINLYSIKQKKQKEMEDQRKETALSIYNSKEEKGFYLYYNEKFKPNSPISISKDLEPVLEKKGYDVSAFKQKLFPKELSLDIANLPPHVSLAQRSNGLEIDSRQGELRINAARFESMGKSLLLELNVSNPSDAECFVQLGAYYFSALKSYYSFLAEEVLKPGETKTLLGFIDVYEQSSYITPGINVKGKVLLKEMNLYQQDHDEFTIVEGEIVERSSLPKPEDTDYPNCRFTARFDGNAIISGSPCNKELLLSIDGFQDKRVLGTNNLKPGDKVRCAIIPVEKAPEELTSIQESDDLLLFALDSYIVSTISRISSYKQIQSSEQIYFKSQIAHYTSIFDEQVNPEIPDYLIQAQKNRIQADLNAASTMLDDYEKKHDDIESRFQKAYTKEKERFPDGYNRVEDSLWRNVNHSFWSLPLEYTLVPKELSSLPKSKVDALVALKDFLSSNGIQLIVSIVPNWYDISARVINNDFIDVPDYQSALYSKQLSEAGVECPYLSGRIIKNYNKFSHAFLYPKDDHPGSTVQYSVAEIISERLKEYQFPRKLQPEKFSHKSVVTSGGLRRSIHVYPADCDIDNHKPGELYTADQICYDGQPVSPDKESEILIIGNSSIQFPMDTPDALQAFLAERICYPVDNYRVNAYGPFTTVIQRLFDNPSHYLKGKKVVILQTLCNILTEETIPWNNIRKMDEQRMLLNGKELVASFSIESTGKFGSDIDHEETRKRWESFGEKNEIKCLDDNQLEIANQTIDEIDLSKPVLVLIQTVRSGLYKTPKLFVNGLSQEIPAGSYVTVLSWQNLSFELPQGTNNIKISIQGEKGTIVGFNHVFIYQ